MACEQIAAERKLQAAEAAKKALLMGGATIRKNVLTGRLEIMGMIPAEKNGMNDACILAGLATQATTQPALMKAFQTAGIKPADAIKRHAHTHTHGGQLHTHS